MPRAKPCKEYGFYIKKTLFRLDLGYYWLWACIRVLLTLAPQIGYIHPDEYFQSVEVFAGKVFKTEVAAPWEFNATFPLRSVPVMYFATSLPLSLLKILSHIYGRHILSTYLVLLVPRLAVCALSFVSDYCLYKICYLYGQNFRRRLLVFASSYVTLTYATRTFSNTLEMLLFNILLYLVASCMAVSEKINFQDDFLKEQCDKAESTADKVRILKLRKTLPAHSTKLCFSIALVAVAGVFNRPTFAVFALAPVFYWLQRGIRRSTTFLHFHARFFLLLLYTIPITLVIILFDSIYYGYLTWGEVINGHIGFHSFVVTPINFIKYNLNKENLAEHGIHPRWLHVLVNIPLLFTFLGVAGILVMVNMLYRGSQSYWSTLPKPQSITGLMTLSVVVPTLALSVFPHQEPRFLTPLLLPLVFLYSHLITRFEEDCPAPVRRRPKLKQKQLPFLEDFDNRPNITGRYLTHIKHEPVTGRHEPALGRYELLKYWFIVNIALTIFYGFVHQGGVYPLAKSFRAKLEHQPKFTTSHLVYSHTYMLPNHLLMQPIPQIGRKPNFFTFNAPSDLKLVLNEISAIIRTGEFIKKTRRRNYKVFYALPASLLPSFETAHSVFMLNSTVRFYYKVDQVFMPHLSTEAPFTIPDVFSLQSVLECFQLVLLEIEMFTGEIR